ncbi:MAG: site-specific DNA-methyltransferase [Anaerolineales bacterium]|nr:site-specific DNA-methyltransferase [Anaerolineales bacterium]
MPTLHWIGKDAVVNHHKEVPFRLLKPIEKLSVAAKTSEFSKNSEVSNADNLLIQGDNLEALKALLPYYAGQVKCIYIDPPYNTGNEGWVYNDNVNSPEMKAWLGKVVGGEAEDLSRHDKWLSMMYPRLVLLREMLKDDGSLWVSIDDNEVHNARGLLNEIFGETNFVASLTWQKRVSPANDAKYFSSDHEYILVYARNKVNWKPNRLTRSEKQTKNYSNPDNDPRGDWSSATYTGPKSIEERPNLFYGIKNPNTGDTIFPQKTAVWKFDQEAHKKHLEENRIYWGANGTNKMPRLKIFLNEVGDVVPRSVLPYTDFGHTSEARTEILRIISEVPFTTPKPSRLIQRLLQIGSNPRDIILDSFAGSGTTGHAVLKQNAEEGGNRRFILVEMDKTIAQSITAERLKRVAEGYSYKDAKGNKKKEAGLGGGFRYCELGVTLFDADGQIREEVKYNDLAQHVYFIETGQPLTARPPSSLRTRRSERSETRKSEPPLLSIHNDTAVYLLYNGILKDKKPNGGNVLTRKVLASLPKHEGPKVIYGTGCLLSEEKLRELNVTFRQIPYEVKSS